MIWQISFHKLAIMKRILITGAAGNLGRALTAKFLHEGWQVIALCEQGRSDQPEILSELNGSNLVVKIGDLNDAYATAKTIRESWSELGQIDAAALLVGGFAMNGIEKTTSEQLDKMMRLNVFTAYNVLQPLFALMASKGGGSFSLIGARPALMPDQASSMVAYALSKGVLFHLAEIINSGSKDHQITAHVMVPSIIDTPENRAAMPDEDPSKWISPEQIAETIYFVHKQSPKGLAGSVYKLYGEV